MEYKRGGSRLIGDILCSIESPKQHNVTANDQYYVHSDSGRRIDSGPGACVLNVSLRVRPARTCAMHGDDGLSMCEGCQHVTYLALDSCWLLTLMLPVQGEDF